jgi:tetratricopeptide (TPR) repeat protein
LGAYLEETGVLDEAWEYSQKAAALARKIGHSVSLANALNTLACVYLKRDDYAAAAAQADEAAAIYLSAGLGPDVREMYELAARASAELGDVERAHEFRSRARSEALQ